ncbi:DNA-binding protein [Kibdelosporangium aridum]|uniref:DNA-binding protein n=1 Tax=Kibdelosporangium aridum TaxID=2030 RepID=A0A428ZBV1_KIBAR|nr:HU family DNA-binding protein [Kibdelosporangium aridum]RSM85501.1 DNA-binding protein [Kibdelosporangium aridum]
MAWRVVVARFSAYGGEKSAAKGRNRHVVIVEDRRVNKAQLIEALTERLGDKKTAGAAVDGLVDVIVRTVNKGEKVNITGFGVFEKRARAARTARNPRTGETVKVKKTNVPAFRPGTGFKEVVSGAKKLPKVAAAKPATSRSTGTTTRAAATRTTASTTRKTAAASTARKTAATKTAKTAAKPAAKTTTTRRAAAKPAAKTTAKATAKKTSAAAAKKPSTRKK